MLMLHTLLLRPSLMQITHPSSCRQLPQLRHQKPVGYVGLWPEFSLLNHSCLPNTAQVVVKDRMLVSFGGVWGRGKCGAQWGAIWQGFPKRDGARSVWL